MNRFLSILLFIILFSNLSAQTLADRLSISVGAAANASTNYEPGMLSLSFIPSYRINKNISISLKYKNHIFQFGTRGKWNINDLKYRHRKSYLDGLKSFSLSFDIHTRILGAHIVISPELLKFFRPEIIEKTVSYKTGQLINTRTIAPKNTTGYAITTGIVFDKIHAGVSLIKTKDIELLRSSTALMSVFINYPIISKEEYYKSKIKEDRLVPSFFIIEGGIQAYGNFGGFAGGFNTYIETKWALNKKWHIGFRGNSKYPNGVGFDKEDHSVLVTSPQSSYYIWKNRKTMGNVYSRLLTIYNYFSRKGNGWFFANTGAGHFHRKEIPAIKENFNGQEVIIVPKKEHQKNFGGFVGMGFKTGAYKCSVEYNFTGRGIPDYLAAQLGVSINFYKSKD